MILIYAIGACNVNHIIYILLVFWVMGCGIKGNPLPPVQVTSQEIKVEPSKPVAPAVKKEIKK
jgi:hypothetical protein